MTLLSKLNLVAAKRVIVRTPQELRRGKLLSKIDEQLVLVAALLAGTEHGVTKQAWVKDCDGNKQQVTRSKRIRPWYWLATDGKWLLEVRYGAKALELGKGKRAIEVGGREEIKSTLELVREAVLAGELDATIEAATGARKLKLPKS